MNHSRDEARRRHPTARKGPCERCDAPTDDRLCQVCEDELFDPFEDWPSSPSQVDVDTKGRL